MAHTSIARERGEMEREREEVRVRVGGGRRVRQRKGETEITGQNIITRERSLTQTSRGY